MEARMNRIPGLPGGTVPLTILLLLIAAPVRAYGITGDAGRSDDTWSDCRIVASVIGGAAGGLLGSALGASLERAVYGGNPDAGLTGGLVGMVVGGVAGVRLARKACGQSSENQLRAHLGLMGEHDLKRTERMHRRGLDHRILVADRMRDRVLPFDLDGALTTAIGRAGDASR
jgi:hypothetical protein